MNRTAAAIAVIILISIMIECSSKTLLDNNQFELELEDETDNNNTEQQSHHQPPAKMSKDAPLVPGCPLCDSSVFSYCDIKIYHDACCCGLSLPQCMYQQQQEGCSFLHANSCQEHHLITRCCCYNPLYRKIE